MKPTMVITNNKAFWALDVGKLSRKKRKGARPTTKRYQDKSGKARFCGTKRLKESQILVSKTNQLLYLCWFRIVAKF